MEIEHHIKNAIKGSTSSTDIIVKSIQQDIYNLALRMLVDHHDAADATQEILIKVLTHLSSFRFNSKFRTWVYRIATNHLLTAKKLVNKYPSLTFEDFQHDLESDLTKDAVDKQAPDHQILLNELRIYCTMAMLLCLTPAQRLAYILGEICELDHSEASDILAIQPATFRRQLSRARQEIIQFTSKSCGLISSSALCHCSKKLAGSIERGCVKRGAIRFAGKEQMNFDEVENLIARTHNELKTLTSFKSIQQYPHYAELSQVLTSVLQHEKKKRIPIQLLN